MVYRKKLFIEKNNFFAVDFANIIELHIIHTWRHMKSKDEIADVMITIKKDQ